MSETGRVVLEAFVVAAVGLGVGLAANTMSPRGLSVSRNYFPKATEGGGTTQPSNGTIGVEPPATTQGVAATQETVVSPPGHAAVERLRNNGLQPISHDEVVQAFNDPQHQVDAILFVDARDDEHYRKGHIPRAVQLDHYRLERYIDVVLPLAQAAEKVIVYCNGGDCEDSEFATIELRNRGVDPTRLFIYVGGMKEWEAGGLPVEKGDRNSGDISTGAAR